MTPPRHCSTPRSNPADVRPRPPLLAGTAKFEHRHAASVRRSGMTCSSNSSGRWQYPEVPAPALQRPGRYSHSIINRSRKPAWLKGFAMIVVSFTVGIYRQKSSLKAGAGYGAICAASTLSALSSIRLHLSALELALERPALRLPTAASHRVFWPPAQARPRWHRGHAVRSPVAIRLALRQWPRVYEQEATPS